MITTGGMWTRVCLKWSLYISRLDIALYIVDPSRHQQLHVWPGCGLKEKRKSESVISREFGSTQRDQPKMNATCLSGCSLLTEGGEISRNGTSVQPVTNRNTQAKRDRIACWGKGVQSAVKKLYWWYFQSLISTYKCKKQPVVPLLGLFFHLSVALNI